MKQQKRLTAALLGAMTATVVILVCMFFLISGSHLMVHLPPTTPLSGQLTEQQSAQMRVFSIALPEDFDAAQSILFKTTHTRVEVCVGRETMYRFGFTGNPSFLRSPGAVWHVVDLPEGSAGSTLSIYLSAVYEDYYGNDLVLSYGSHAGCELALLMDSLPIAIIDCIILFAGALCLMMHFIGRLHRRSTGFNRFLLVALFSFAIAIWSLCQSGFLQFFIPDGPTLYLIDFFSFNLFPVPFNLFLAAICVMPRQQRMFGGLAALYLIDLALSCALQFAGVFDMFSLMVVTHALMAANVFCVYAGIRQEVTQANNHMAAKYRIPLYVVMLFALLELVIYYINDFRQTSVFLPLGTIVFIIMLMWNLVAQYYTGILEEQKIAYFKKLASTDMLTEVFNRNAYEHMLRRFDQHEIELMPMRVILFDVDNLKLINDHYGHEKGDEALRCCCRCIRKAFGEDVSCYRIGGDEFVCLTERIHSFELDARRFEQETAEMARTLDFPFSVSMGWASFDPQMDHRLSEVIHRCDEMLYRNKEQKAEFVMPEDFSTAFAKSVDT